MTSSSDSNEILAWLRALQGMDADVDSRAAWQHYWGDEYEWTRLLPIVWAAVDSPALHDLVAAQARTASRRGAAGALAVEHVARWSAVLHLLAFGMGWTDLYAGVDRWRDHRFEVGHHPVLDLVARMVGDDVIALPEFLARWNSNLGGAIAHHLGGSRDQGAREFTRVSWSADLDVSADTTMSVGARALLDGGSDPLHLIGHFNNSLEVEADASPRLTQIDEVHHLLRLPRYAGWARTLATLGIQSPMADGSLSGAIVGVESDGIGSLGWYHGPGPESGGRGRWFRLSETYGSVPAQFESHAWGA